MVPTLGSKEAIYGLAQVVGRGRGAVAVTTPGYPVAERSAVIEGLDVVSLPLDGARGWMPDLDAVPWDRLAILWLNSPGNPTGAVASVAFLEEAAARCRRHDVILACDEAYCELWFEGDPPPSALQIADRRGVLAFHSLSKRSSMPGYRSGFVAGDPELIALLKRHRPTVGTAPAAVRPARVDRGVVRRRARGRDPGALRGQARDRAAGAARRPAWSRSAGRHRSSCWLRVPGDGDDAAFAARWLERGVVLAPGSYLGAGGEGHVRAALVPTLEECERAAELLAGE